MVRNRFYGVHVNCYLVAAHAGVEASPPSLASGSRPRHGHPHPPPTDVEAVRAPARLVRVLLPLEHHEGEAGDAARHPDLHHGPVLPERLLDVPLGGVAVQVSHVEPQPVHVRARRPRPGSSSRGS